ncbi:SpoIIE family protein phosphatase [Phytohabitans sp. ZYX-F-186]|uniref:SpoIIE family protein phosphatase n=1 Tax=Phytohabitans maris TaxID=3071409 RepID=A0ABU0ZPL1_9ACTN|nr:SpoIIE family protein phosphatase [Phytohabitans sp. ZYX-F-186]MDQ7908974.1 SpoIIE family protein phosphatase [Phytohabitans sp. ZYX-F-186]
MPESTARSTAEILDRLTRTERLGNLGWAEWDLTTDTVHWSDHLYEIFERDRAAGPATLARVRKYVLPDDVGRFDKAAQALIGDAQPIDVTCRIVVPSGVRHIRAIFEAERGRDGRVRVAYGIMQDVSVFEAAERDRARLADIEAESAELQASLQTEHRVVAALQQVILPVPEGTVRRPGLRAAVRYQPAEELARVGGDWFDLVHLPGDRTLLAVGDVAGHGMPAAATMARLRHALSALAVTTDDPARLLAYLNQMVCDDPTGPTATAAVARFDPETSSVTWAQAGHPPPVLLTRAGATPLDRPEGMLVGALRGSEYATAVTELAPGDTMLIFTDGLIERRTYDSDWLGPVLRAVAGAAELPLEALLARLQPASADDDTCVLALRAVVDG